MFNFANMGESINQAKEMFGQFLQKMEQMEQNQIKTLELIDNLNNEIYELRQEIHNLENQP